MEHTKTQKAISRTSLQFVCYGLLQKHSSATLRTQWKRTSVDTNSSAYGNKTQIFMFSGHCELLILHPLFFALKKSILKLFKLHYRVNYQVRIQIAKSWIRFTQTHTSAQYLYGKYEAGTSKQATQLSDAQRLESKRHCQPTFVS